MKSFEIFSGTGGLAKGLEVAGFKHAAFVEFNRHACSSLRVNFDPGKIFEGDIRDFDLGSLSHIDVVAGGPPCQPFSLGGKHKAHDDHRDMFPYAIRAIERLTPKAFIFENVKGLLRSSFSDYFECILLRLTYPGFKPKGADDWREHLSMLRRVGNAYTGVRYNVSHELLNAADYGVPQTRERVVIVGIRSDLGVKWEFPEKTHSQDRLLWDMHVTGEYWRRHGIEAKADQLDPQNPIVIAATMKQRYGMFEPEPKPWRTVRDALAGVPDPQAAHGIPDHLFRSGARSYLGHTGSYINWPSKTIKAGGHGVPGGENMIRFENGDIRYFTVYEAKLVQTFPANFQVLGAWGEALRQVGNAVPVRLASVLGKQLWETLHRKKASHSEDDGRACRREMAVSP
jgi:DNA (cytosine-5)-methyltransferase 1